MTIWVTSRTHAANYARQHGARRVVSLLAPGDAFPVVDGLGDDQHLKLSFDDIDEPMAGLKPPEEDDVVRLIEFVKDWDRNDPLLIHCWAGISRSSASAFITACLHNPGIDERNIANAIRRASRTAKPNRRIIQMADRILKREGRMMDAVAGMNVHEFAEEAVPFNIPSRYDQVRGHWV